MTDICRAPPPNKRFSADARAANESGDLALNNSEAKSRWIEVHNENGGKIFLTQRNNEEKTSRTLHAENRMH